MRGEYTADGRVRRLRDRAEEIRVTAIGEYPDSSACVKIMMGIARDYDVAARKLELVHERRRRWVSDRAT